MLNFEFVNMKMYGQNNGKTVTKSIVEQIKELNEEHLNRCRNENLRRKGKKEKRSQRKRAWNELGKNEWKRKLETDSIVDRLDGNWQSQEQYPQLGHTRKMHFWLRNGLIPISRE